MLTPYGRRVALELTEKKEEKTKSGIILADGKEKGAVDIAKVVAVSPDLRGDLEVGDVVAYRRYSGDEVKEEKVIVVDEEEVIGIIEE